MEFMQFISPELLVTIPILNIIGSLLKQAKKFPNWLIPITLILFGITFCFVYTLGMNDFVFTGKLFSTALVQGLLTSLSAVGANQVVKQSKKRN